jgi:phage-related protein
MATLATMTVRLGIDTSALAAGARRAAQTAQRMGAAIQNGVTTGAQHAGKAMLSVGTIGAKAFAVMSAGAVGAAGALAGVGLAFAGLGVKIAAQNKGVQDAFTGLKDHVTSTMQDLAKPIVGPLKDAAGQLKGIFDSLAPQIGAIFKTVGPMIQPLVAGFGEFAKGLLSGVVPAMQKMQPLIESIGGLLGDLGAGLGGFIQGLSSGMGEAAGVFDSLGGVVKTILPVLGQLMGQMLKVAGPILAKLLDGLSPVIEMLGQALGPIIEALGPVLGALVDAFLALVQAVMPLVPPIMQLVVALLPALTPILQALIPMFGAFGEIVKALVPIITPIIALVGELAGILANQLAAFIETVIVPALKMVAALLRGDFSQAFEYAKQALSGALDFIVSMFTEFPGKIIQAIGPLAGMLWNAMKAASLRMLIAIQQGISDLVAKVKRIPQMAKDAVSGIGATLLNAGKELIRGFIRGISSMIGNVKSTLGDLTSRLTSWKGPESLDRKILTPNGQMVIGGFMKGIDKATPGLRSQLQGLTSDLPGMAMDVNPHGVFRSATRMDQRMVVDVTGADEDMKRLIRRIVKTQGRGSVQTAFG